MRRKVVDVSPNRREGGWDVKQGKEVLSHHTKKDNAVQAGRKDAKEAELGQLRIRREDGTIQTEHTYGQDPHPPKG